MGYHTLPYLAWYFRISSYSRQSPIGLAPIFISRVLDEQPIVITSNFQIHLNLQNKYVKVKSFF